MSNEFRMIYTSKLDSERSCSWDYVIIANMSKFLWSKLLAVIYSQVYLVTKFLLQRRLISICISFFSFFSFFFCWSYLLIACNKAKALVGRSFSIDKRADKMSNEFKMIYTSKLDSERSCSWDYVSSLTCPRFQGFKTSYKSFTVTSHRLHEWANAKGW